MGRAARTAAALVVATAVLAGCSEAEPASQTLPSTSAQAAPTTEALPPLGPADFPMPPEARERTSRGAVEFTRYYMQLVEYIGDSDLDPQPITTLSANCDACDQIATSFREDRAEGCTYDDVWVRMTPYDDEAFATDHGFDVGFVYEQGPLVVRDASGQIVDNEGAAATGPLQSGALVEWKNDISSWVVTSLTIG
jgi:Family of unknown function (DUF6318)